MYLSFLRPRRLALNRSSKAFDSSDASYDGLLVGVAKISGSGGAFAATKVGKTKIGTGP